MSGIQRYKRVARVAIWIVVLFVCSVLTSTSLTWVQRHFEIPTPDTRIAESILIDVAEVLGPEWQISVREGGTPSIEDLQGEWIGVKGTIDRFTRYKTKRGVFIHQFVTQYVDEDVAYNRYLAQEEWNFSGSDSTDVAPVSSLRNLTDNITLHADDYHLAWAYVDDDSARCEVLLHYQDTIIFVNMWSVWDSTIYISGDDILSLLTAIDEKTKTLS